MSDKRVPREPTPEMEQAAYDIIPVAPGTETWAIGRYPHPGAIWRAMHDAAPATLDEPLRAALLLVLDQVDYTNGACSATNMVGACLPTKVIDIARAALATTKDSP